MQCSAIQKNKYITKQYTKQNRLNYRMILGDDLLTVPYLIIFTYQAFSKFDYNFNPMVISTAKSG